MIDIHFSIAKHIPDLERLEPRNVGVVAWGTGGLIESQFLGESAEGVHVPAFMDRSMRDVYSQWIFFWRHHLDTNAIVTRKGIVVNRDSPQFLAALREKSKEAFQLVEAGVLQADRTEMAKVVKDLFTRLVAPQDRKHAIGEATELAERCSEIISHAGISRRTDYQPKLPIPRYVHGVLREFTADYALGPVGDPLVVMQKVLLTRHQSIDSSAFMFTALTRDDARPMRVENCLALVDARHALDKASQSGLRMLDKVSTVVDVSDPWAEKKLLELSQRTGADLN